MMKDIEISAWVADLERQLGEDEDHLLFETAAAAEAFALIVEPSVAAQIPAPMIQPSAASTSAMIEPPASSPAQRTYFDTLFKAQWKILPHSVGSEQWTEFVAQQMKLVLQGVENARNRGEEQHSAQGVSHGSLFPALHNTYTNPHSFQPNLISPPVSTESKKRDATTSTSNGELSNAQQNSDVVPAKKIKL